MHEKFFSEKKPTLADGDFMGFFIGQKTEVFADLVKEGLERKEKIFVSERILRRYPNTLNLGEQNVDVLLDPNLLEVEKLVSSQIEYEEGSLFSGHRYLIDSESFFSDLENHVCRCSLDGLLKSLMHCQASVGIVFSDLQKISLTQLSSFPRVYVNDNVVSNKFFIMPTRLNGKNSEISLIFEDLAEKSRPDTPQNGETFPMLIPGMLESIIESLGVGVVVGDRYGNMVLYNKASSKMMGLPPSPLPYAERIRRFGNYLPDKITPYPYEQLPLSRAIKGEDFDNELIYVSNPLKPSGTWIQTMGRGVRDSEGALIGGVLVSKDVTEEKKLQEENEFLEKSLVQNQKLESLGVLAGGIAHDFNNLLVGVLGNASIILQQGGVSESLRPRVEQIQEAGFQLNDLTKQLLIYAGIRPNQEYEVFNLNELVQTMKGLVESVVSKKMQVKLKLSLEPLFLSGDEVQLRQILLNLAMNAADAYSDSAGELEIRTREKFVDEVVFKRSFFSAAEGAGSYVCFEVADQAGGIEPGCIERVFDPFYSTKGMGRGLGLSAVLGIIKAHKGFLELKTNKGVGTKFSVWFPAVSEPKKIVSNPNLKASDSYHSKRVLIIDDEQLVLDVAKAILSHHGLSVLGASSGTEGLNILRREIESIDLLVLDMNMPDINGDEVYRVVRNLTKALPIIISSGFSKELCVLDRTDDSKCYFLEKPYSSEKLLTIIEEVFS